MDSDQLESDGFRQLTEKYRPRKFEHLFGQRVARAVLENMVRSGKVAPTIMLSGGFGIGKTTSALMLARYLNCKTQDACGKCLSCLSIERGTSSDVQEVDIADATGIDHARQLIQHSQFKPRGRYRIIIMDEIQQLSKPAQQAMLKTFENPSPQTIFILCTTDPGKVLPTIKSRCQHIKLQELTVPALTSLLSWICEEEKLSYPETALKTVATMANGHARNAVMLLDQVVKYSSVHGDVDNLQEMLPSIIDEMTSIPPETLVLKYMQLLLNTRYRQAVETARLAENQAYFLQLAFKFLSGFLLFLKSPGPDAGSVFIDFNKDTEFKRVFGAQHLIKLMTIHLDGYERIKRFESEAQDIVDLVVFQSLEVMETAPKMAKIASS